MDTFGDHKRAPSFSSIGVANDEEIWRSLSGANNLRDDADSDAGPLRMTSEAERDLDQYILVDDNYDDGQAEGQKAQHLERIVEEEPDVVTPPARHGSNSTANFNESFGADRGYDELADAAVPQDTKYPIQRADPSKNTGATKLQHQTSAATNSSGSSKYNMLSVFQNPRQLFRKSGSAETEEVKPRNASQGASSNSAAISSPGLPRISGSDSSDYVHGHARRKKAELTEVKLIEVRDIDEDAKEEKKDVMKVSSGGTGEQLGHEDDVGGDIGKLGAVPDGGDSEDDTGLRRIQTEDPNLIKRNMKLHVRKESKALTQASGHPDDPLSPMRESEANNPKLNAFC